MKTVVLGSNGFVGRHLMRRLNELDEEPRGFTSKFDLRNPAFVRSLADFGFDTCLIILAAVTPDKNRRALIDNLQMLINLSRHLRTYPMRQVIYFSSDAVYADQSEPIQETSSLDLNQDYSLAKIVSERLLQRMSEEHDTLLTILRPTLIIGPGDTHHSYGPNRFAHQAHEFGKVTVFGQGEELRDYIYIDDVVDLTLLMRDRSGIFNLATGTSRPISTIVDAMERHLEFEVLYAPRQQPVTHRSFDIRKLVKVVPEYRFMRFEEAIWRTCAGS